MNGQAETLPKSRGEIALSFAPVVNLVSPSVVNIYTKRTVLRTNPVFNDPFFQQFFGNGMFRPSKKVENTLGSGVIVDKSGLILTNHHVIAGAEQIRVSLKDKREFDAKLILDEPELDLALLKLQGVKGELPAATLGDPEQWQVGDLVVAIGNPFGIGQTVTSGIISGLARSGVGISDIESFIQTDAPINPGNSGGALVALNGDVIGINTAIFSRTGASNGIGFAVPAPIARLLVKAGQTGQPIFRPWLGMKLSEVNADIGEASGLEYPHGALIESLHPASAAAKAGLQAGDLILEVWGKPLISANELAYRALLAGQNANLPLVYLRYGKPQKVNLTLMVAPEDPPANQFQIDDGSPLSGMTVANYSPAIAQKFGLIDTLNERGVVVVNILPNSLSARFGFEVGDVLREISRQKIDNTTTLRSVVSGIIRKGPFEILLERDGKIQRMVFR